MPARPWPPFLDPQDVLRHPDAWRQVDRDEALRLEAQGAVLAVIAGTSPVVMRFDENSPFRFAFGPYDYAALRYFLHLGTGPTVPTALGGGKRPVKPKAAEPVEDEELVPLESGEEEPEVAPPPVRSKVDRQAEAPAEVFELRFDLALDPATPGLEDDVFVLEGLDSEYRQTKSVRDDQVAGDGKLTLVFTEVEKGRKYRLSQQTGEAELLLVPEVVCEGRVAEKAGGGGAAGTRAAKASAPRGGGTGAGEVIGCKAVFRECRIRGEKEDFYNQSEAEYQFEVVPIVGKWVYVFGGPQGKPATLIAEGVGVSGGRFRPVDLSKNRGKNRRDPLAMTCEWLTLPLKVNGAAWTLHTCLSPIQLPWKRIEQLAARPAPRCYKVGEKAGGLLWAPDNLGREVPTLLGLKDKRLKEPGEGCLLIGLVDPMAEAKRRASVYQKHAEPYLSSRFDLPDPAGKSPVTAAQRRRKYVAGTLKVLIETHPEGRRLRKALADNGKALDAFLREEDEKEIRLKRSMEKSGSALVKWMDHPSGLFEAALRDHTADPSIKEHWEAVEEDFAFLVRHFDVSSLTRLYGRKITERKDSWLNEALLSEDAFSAARQLTQAAVEILSWLGKVLVMRKEFDLKILERAYRLWVPGLVLERRRLSSLEYKSLVMDFFPDERVKRPAPERVRYWEALAAPGYHREIDIIWVSNESQPMKKLAKTADGRLTKALLLGLEGANVVLAAKEQVGTKKEHIDANDLSVTLDLFTLIAENIRIAGKQIGRGLISTLGGLSACLDLYLAFNQAKSEANEKDYDAMTAQVIVAAGSLTTAAGASMIAFSVYAGAAGGNLISTLVFAGSSLSMTGAGAPLGAALCLTGMLVMAAGSVGYFLWNDRSLETWFKQSPFGVLPKWSFGDATAPRIISEFTNLLFPWKVVASHRFLGGQSDYAVTVIGPFVPHTKVKLHSLDLIDDQDRATRFLENEILRTKESRDLKIWISPQRPASLTLALRDEFCWQAHRNRNPGAKNGFAKIRVSISIDQYGDGEILWPSGTESATLDFPV